MQQVQNFPNIIKITWLLLNIIKHVTQQSQYKVLKIKGFMLNLVLAAAIYIVLSVHTTIEVNIIVIFIFTRKKDFLLNIS